MTEQEMIKALQDAGHVLVVDKDGDVDITALDFEYHNGPVCRICRESWCLHCQDEIAPCDGPDRIDYTYNTRHWKRLAEERLEAANRYLERARIAESRLAERSGQ